MDDAGWNREVVERAAESASARSSESEQPWRVTVSGVVVDLQRADAGREIDDAGGFFALEPLQQRLDAEAQIEVENRLAVFDEQVAVAGCAADDVLAGRR